MEFLSKNEKETAKIASDFARELKPKGDGATMVGLYGELGSGKTTFMKYLAQSFGLKDEIKSPTFVIEKIYDLTPNPSSFEGEGSKNAFNRLIHIDAYRIEDPKEMEILGWQEIISNPQNLVCIEWPEKITKIMPPHIIIKFEHARETERKISIA